MRAHLTAGLIVFVLCGAVLADEFVPPPEETGDDAVAAPRGTVPLPPGVAPPPQPLRLVDGHWTPYDPPAGCAEGATLHVIEPGDTLWDLADAYLGDPYLWPQIWEQNPYIRDSHWIYPGDPLCLALAVAEPEPLPPAEPVPAPEEPLPEPLPAGDLPQPLAAPADVYCFVELHPEGTDFPMAITSGEEIEFQNSFAPQDVVYLEGGDVAGVLPGERFMILEQYEPGGVFCSWSRELFHPATGDDIGILYRQVGQLRALCVQDGVVIAEIEEACDPINVGDVVRPYRSIPIPLVTMPDPTEVCDEPNGLATGYVTYLKDDVTGLGAGGLVTVDLGPEDGLYPGRFATIWRPNPVEGMPRIVIGELGVLTTSELGSTAIITDSWAPVRVGDRIELK